MGILKQPRQPEKAQLEPGLKAIYIGGNSERKRAMELGLSVLDSTDFFSDITPYTINQADGKKGQRAIRKAGAPGEKVVFVGHSMGLSRVPRGYQALGINPAEAITLAEQIEGGKRILKNDMDPEEGAHNTGFLDMVGAIWQQVSSPITTARTSLRLNNGYSSVDHLTDRSNFPGGAVLVHSDGDNFEAGFGFAERAQTPEKLEAIRVGGATLVIVQNSYHNSWLFEPRVVLGATGTEVFPQDAIERMNAA